ISMPSLAEQVTEDSKFRHTGLALLRAVKQCYTAIIPEALLYASGPSWVSELAVFRNLLSQ
ncbi:hypothetical protein PENANT_c130G01892, partial [Penicillium antarcticum]